jgi:hypothetical protein
MAGLPGARWIRLALPAGRPLGGRSEGAGADPRAWRAGTGLGEAGAAVARRWACSARSNTNFEPARSSPLHDQNPATRLRETQGTSNRLGNRGKLKGLRRVRANPAGIWMTWCLAAAGPPLTPRSVVGEGEAAGLNCHRVFRRLAGSAGFGSMFRFVVLHIGDRMPVSRASPASQPPGPARRAAVRRSKGVIAWQPLQAPGRQPPDVRGSAAPGNCLAAAPKPGRVRLPGGWPVGQSWRWWWYQHCHGLD